jgi:hypothetical protein
MKAQPCALIWEVLWGGTIQKKLGTAPATDPDSIGLGKWSTDPLLRIYPLRSRFPNHRSASIGFPVRAVSLCP